MMFVNKIVLILSCLLFSSVSSASFDLLDNFVGLYQVSEDGEEISGSCLGGSLDYSHIKLAKKQYGDNSGYLLQYIDLDRSVVKDVEIYEYTKNLGLIHSWEFVETTKVYVNRASFVVFHKSIGWNSPLSSKDSTSIGFRIKQADNGGVHFSDTSLGPGGFCEQAEPLLLKKVDSFNH